MCKVGVLHTAYLMLSSHTFSCPAKATLCSSQPLGDSSLHYSIGLHCPSHCCPYCDEENQRFRWSVVNRYFVETKCNSLTSQVDHLFSPMANVTPSSTPIEIFVCFFTILSYEVLLVSFAMWAAIRYSRCCSSRTSSQSLRIILIEGNLMYFLVQ